MKLGVVRIALALLLSASAVAAKADELAVLARIGPWPVADQLIAYQGKVWFSTSVKGVDHNSADIWSFDPASRTTRFERYLFSQDAGHPVVHEGLLFWPQEDMRIGLGTGVVSVTDGVDWRDLFIPVDDHMMHTHASAEWRGELVVAMAGWNAALAATEDAGESWRVLANDPPATGSFHRYNDLAVFGDRLFVRHWSRTGPDLKEYRDGQLTQVPGWPQNRDFSKLVQYDSALYGIVHANDGPSQLWRITDNRAEQVHPPIPGVDMQLLANDGEALWIVGRSADGGQLWKSTGGEQFAQVATFRGGSAQSVVARAPGEIYVGGEGLNGQAILWGPLSAAAPIVNESASVPLSDQRSDPTFDVDANRALLLAHLKDLRSYERHGRPLRGAIASVLAMKPPQGFFASLLYAAMPADEIEVFGGQFKVAARDIAQWYLIAAIARNRGRSVPPELLSQRWLQRSNRPQKWFDPLLIALHAVQLSGQNDRATMDALVSRLGRQGDPDWLSSQVTGTLAAVSGEHFAYDHEAWRNWWASARASWAE